MLADAVRTYFTGERALGFALVVVGLAALGAAYAVWRTQPGSFALGFAIPAVVFGLAGTVGGALLERRSADQLARLVVDAEQRPADLVAAEAPRMAQVNANWPRLKAAWAVVTLLSFALLLLVKKDGAAGAAVALVAIAAILTTVDVFAERRARPYTAALAAR